jgi:N-hydroxyarylamine O-acetyltransferase
LPERRLGLRNGRLTVRRVGGDADSRRLETVDALRAALTEEFGITLPEDEILDDVLGQVIAGSDGSG